MNATFCSHRLSYRARARLTEASRLSGSRGAACPLHLPGA